MIAGVLADRAGFEPALGYYPKHAFQACDLNHSSTCPVKRGIIAAGARIRKRFLCAGRWALPARNRYSSLPQRFELCCDFRGEGVEFGVEFGEHGMVP